MKQKLKVTFTKSNENNNLCNLFFYLWYHFQMKKILILLVSAILFYSCGNNKNGNSNNANKALQDSVQSFLNDYNKKYQELNIVANETSWLTQTRIIEGDSPTSVATNKAHDA